MKQINVEGNEYFLNEYYGSNLENKIITLKPYHIEIASIEYTPEYSMFYDIYLLPKDKDKEREEISSIINLESGTKTEKEDALNILEKHLLNIVNDIRYYMKNNKKIPIKVNCQVVEPESYSKESDKKVIIL